MSEETLEAINLMPVSVFKGINGDVNANPNNCSPFMSILQLFIPDTPIVTKIKENRTGNSRANGKFSVNLMDEMGNEIYYAGHSGNFIQVATSSNFKFNFDW